MWFNAGARYIALPSIKDAVVVGLQEDGHGPVVHGILLIDDPDHAKAAVQQTNQQLAPHQQIRNYTIWPDEDFPRTYTLKVRRPEVLEKLQSIKQQKKQEEGNTSTGGSRTSSTVIGVHPSSPTPLTEKR